jgi:hypothetical protein
MPVPTIEPQLHPAGRDLDTEDFQPGQPVWVHRAGAWRPGVVLHRSSQAVTVRYRPADGPGTGVDTVTARSVAVRDDSDPFLDHPEFS